MPNTQRPRLYPYTQPPSHPQPYPPHPRPTPTTSSDFALAPLTNYSSNSNPNLSTSQSYTTSLHLAIIDTCKGHITFQRLRELLAAAQLAGFDVGKLKAAQDDLLAKEILEDTLEQARRGLIEEGEGMA